MSFFWALGMGHWAWGDGGRKRKKLEVRSTHEDGVLI